MGDRTRLTCIIADCPDDQAPAIAKVFERWAICGEADAHLLALNDAYWQEKISAGASEEFARALMDAAPQASFEVWEDPAHEWLGDVFRYTPDLGLWHSECAANGEAVYDVDQVLKLHRPQLTTDALKRRLGETHKDALRKLSLTTGERLIALPLPQTAQEVPQ